MTLIGDGGRMRRRRSWSEMERPTRRRNEARSFGIEMNSGESQIEVKVEVFSRSRHCRVKSNRRKSKPSFRCVSLKIDTN